jgi:hypothetical protein
MSLAGRTKTALDELRMLMMGAQILLGFQFHAPFENAFGQLSSLEKKIEIVVLGTIMIVVGLLIAPSARHRILEQGEATRGINDYISRIAMVTLAPFALAMALDLGLAASRALGAPIGTVVGATGGAIALGLWYGPLLLRDKRADPIMSTSDEKTPTAAKIDYVLTEARVVLPGAQALLGFQFAIVLTTGFAELPPSAKALHGAALVFVAVSALLLMAPAAYHRIVYNGGEAPEFYQVASRFVLLATVFLALGLTADIQVVTAKISGSWMLGAFLALAIAIMLSGLWLFWPWWLRVRRAQRR